MLQGPTDIGRDAIFGTKLSINGGLHVYSSLPEPEQTFVRKCINYRDARVGNPKASKNRLGDIFHNRTPAKLSSASFTAIHIFSADCFDEGTAHNLGRLWDDELLLEEFNAWEPPANWQGMWKLEKRFNSDGLLLFHEKIDFCPQYIQFTDRGVFEAVDHSLHHWALHTRTIPGIHWEDGVLKILPALIKALKLIGGETPAGICLSIRDSLEYMTVSYDKDTIKHGRPMDSNRMGIKEDLLTVPIAILTHFDEDLTRLMKPCFDALAKAGGLAGSPRYRTSS